MIFLKIFRKIYKFIFLIFIIFISYINIKNLIKNKLTPKELVEFSGNIKESSKNIKESSELIKTAILNPLFIINAQSILSSKIENSIIIRNDKIMDFNNTNQLFCGDKISFLIEGDDKKVEKFKQIEYGSFSILQEKYPNIDYALQFAEIGQNVNFTSIVRNKNSEDKKIYRYKLELENYTKTDKTINLPYFFYNSRNLQNKRGNCDSMFSASIAIKSKDKAEFFHIEKLEFNLSKNFFPTNIEKIILNSFKEDIVIIPIKIIDLTESEFYKNLEKDIKIIKDIIFLEIKIIDIF